MIENVAQKERFYRWLPLYGVLTALVVLAPLLCRANLDVVYIFLVSPFVIIASVVVLIFAAFRKTRRQILRVLAMLAMFWIVSFLLVKNDFLIRSSARWLLWSHDYKAEVLAQPTPLNGEFKHIEWEATGFAGVANNTTYLVFDPTDSLAAAAKSRRPGKFNGIPCKVPHVSRLETRWYTVSFYTDEGWGKHEQDCGFDLPFYCRQCTH
jgi:hypothetical protein